MSVVLSFQGDLPFDVTGIRLDGYHRPLNGEVANLTVVAARESFNEGWLQCPPLGLACRLSFDGEALFDGALFGVRVSGKTVELRIEG